MPLERDAILLDNLKGTLALYQRAVLWSMTASAVFFLLSLRLRNPNRAPIQVLYGELSVEAAWALALALFFLLGGFALSMLGRAEALLAELNPPITVRRAILSVPSLATIPNAFYRVGVVLFCPLAVFAAMAIELHREWVGRSFGDIVSNALGGLLMFAVLVLALYLSIARHVWRPFGSSSGEPGPPKGDALPKEKA
jgi:hypothetical protein